MYVEKRFLTCEDPEVIRKIAHCDTMRQAGLYVVSKWYGDGMRSTDIPGSDLAHRQELTAYINVVDATRLSRQLALEDKAKVIAGYFALTIQDRVAHLEALTDGLELETFDDEARFGFDIYKGLRANIGAPELRDYLGALYTERLYTEQQVLIDYRRNLEGW